MIHRRAHRATALASGQRGGIGARRRAAVGLAATVLALAFSSTGSAPSPALAAGRIGPYGGAGVVCDSFTDRMTVNGVVGASADYNTQSIYYAIYLYQEGVGFRALNPPIQGQIDHTRTRTEWDYINQSTYTVTDAWTVTPAWTINPGAGKYAVLTKYWWYENGWIGPYEVWATQVTYQYMGGPSSTFWCDLNLTLL